MKNQLKQDYSKLDSATAIFENVMAEYFESDQMLNSLFFDFNVSMKEKDLLQVYAKIQKEINDDDVVRLVNLHWDNNHHIQGVIADLIPSGAYENMYTGNMQTFLESFIGKESDTGIYRIMDLERQNDRVNGIKLAFID